MNRFDFVGRLTHEPEEKATATGDPVYRIRIAVNRTFKSEGQPDADFFTLSMLGKTAERFGKLNVQKGTKLLFTGEIRNNNWTDKEGAKHYDCQFVCNQFEFLEAKNSQNPGVSAPAEDNPKPQKKVAETTDFMPLDDVNDDWMPWN